MFKEMSKNTTLPQMEEKILQYWQDHRIFEKTLEKTKDGKNFVFFEGPPTANGKPGIHHVMSRTVKDIVCRHKTMTGHNVQRKAGWDTHGLPVEIEVEKQLKISGKEQIEEYGIGEFNSMCRHSVFSYKSEWDVLTERIGYWLDLENPYITYENDYIESVWWILKQLWDKELIYQGYKILPYCPRCETPLSSHEVSQGYKEVKDPSIYVTMELEEEPDTYFLVWTTTPWTLISNVALAVGSDVKYVLVADHDKKYIIAEARVGDLFEEGSYTIEKTFNGSELAGVRYKRIFNYNKVDKDAFYVTEADFVTTEDGTGIVHIAPAFGEDDNQLGRKYELPVIRPVDATGSFTSEITDYAGMFVKEADKKIIADLKERRILVKKKTIEHSYPHCWRCQSPLIYYARESWFIKTSKFKEAMLSNNAKINWYPKEVGEGRFGEWLKNNVDWSLSRDRFWGTPLNIWTCESCGHQDAVGSVEQLFDKAIDLNDQDKEKVDLHRPYVDDVHLKCDACGGRMKRVPEVIDCWFDSGSMPIAQWHYPFENKELFKKRFPADFICEGIDQTRGWFYSLLAISTLLFDQPAYKNIVVNELILDKNGQKMSKSKGNAVQPDLMIDKYGADAIRWYLMTVSSPWTPKKFDPEGVAEVQRKFINTLLNTYSFFALYANIDNFNRAENPVPFEDRPEIDRWILSRLYSIIQKVEENFNKFDLTRATRLISEYLIDDVSNWYVRRNRRRFWKAGESDDKLAAYQTLFEVLLTLSKLIAPYAPFLSEQVYLSLTDNADELSVHLTDYPVLSENQKLLINQELEDKMFLAQQVVTSARALRNEAQIKVRQPLSELLFVSEKKQDRMFVQELNHIISEELNVKEVSLKSDASEIVNLVAKPNFRVLGAKAGKLMGRLSAAIKNFDASQIQSFLTNGYEHILIDGHEFRLEPEDVEIVAQAKDGYVAQSDRSMTVALNIYLDEALLEEGFAREFVNRVQNFRKEAGFEVTDHIIVQVQNLGEKEAGALLAQKAYICNETLADDITIGSADAEFLQETKIEKHSLLIGLSKIV